MIFQVFDQGLNNYFLKKYELQVSSTINSLFTDMAIY
jgi:hypothetical protein